MKEHRSLRCYITASPKLDALQTKELLINEGIKSYEKPLMTYTTKLANIKESINLADFVFALVSLDNLSESVLFEIGVAYGIGKPTIILVQGDGPIPQELADFVYIRGKADFDSIKFSLQQFLKKNNLLLEKNSTRGISNNLYNIRMRKFPRKSNLDIKTAQAEKTVDSNPLTNNPQSQSSDYLSKPNLSEAEIIQFLFPLFQKKGAIVSQGYGPHDIGVDMALWIDSITNSLGNPILIEVKIGHITEERLSEAEKQLKGYLITTNVQSGLLLYLDFERKHFGRSANTSPLIIRLDIRELVKRLEKQSLVHILLSERDAMVHLRG